MHHSREIMCLLCLLWIHIQVICQFNQKCLFMGATCFIIMLVKLSLFRTLEINHLPHCTICQMQICCNTLYQSHNLRFWVHLVYSNICHAIHQHHALFLEYHHQYNKPPNIEPIQTQK